MIHLILLPLAAAYHNAVLENAIIGVPKVVCEENNLAVDIITSKPFQGNIFVKGRAKESSCKQSFSSNSTNSYSLPLGKCGMQRLRSANPRGISFVVTLIVSFHPAGFITKNDRAFHVRCFYMEPDEVVTSGIEVSALATTVVQDEMNMPKCHYTVRRDSVNGPALTFANVGDTVFHVWECTGPDMGILVKKCFVTDGDGEDHAVVDFDGCATDSSLLSELTYDLSLMKAHAQSQVFKYADSNQLYFTCQIRLCQKQMGLCQGTTPPKCDGERNKSASASTDEQRRLRRRSAWLEGGRVEHRDVVGDGWEVDVAVPDFLVLDVDERLPQILGTLDSCRHGCSTQELLRQVETVKMSEVNGCSEDVRCLFRRVKRVFQLKDEMEREMQVKACTSGLPCSSRRLFDESDSLLFSSSIVASSCYSRLSQTDSGFCDASHLSDQDPSPRPSLSTTSKTLTRFDYSHSSSPLISFTDSFICQLILFLCLVFVLALLSSRLVISTQVSFDTPPPT